MDADLRRRTAFHEAGHAVARAFVGATITPIEVRENGDGESHGTGTRWTCRSEGEHAAWDYLLMLLAGAYCEARHARDWVTEILLGPASGDHEEAQATIAWLVDRGFAVDADAAWRRAEASTQAFMRQRWSAITRVAEALVQRGRLSADDVAALAGQPEP